MSYRVVYAKSFHRALTRLTQKEQKMVVLKVMRLAENPFYPSLRSKKIKGTPDLFECSVNMDIRIIWKYNELEKDLLMMLDVGHHSIVDKM